MINLGASPTARGHLGYYYYTVDAHHYAKQTTTWATLSVVSPLRRRNTEAVLRKGVLDSSVPTGLQPHDVHEGGRYRDTNCLLWQETMTQKSSDILSSRIDFLSMIATRPGDSVDQCFIALTLAALDNEDPVPMSPVEADSRLSGLAVLERVRDLHPELMASGGIDSVAHYGSVSEEAGEWVDLDLSHIDQIHGGYVDDVKPAEGGLYTSSGSDTYRGMWRECFLPAYANAGYPPPWRTYRLSPLPTARVLEVSSAVDWCEFATSYPHDDGAFVVPDWTVASKAFDGLRVTLEGALAIQCMVFELDGQLVRGGLWDTETTIWFGNHFNDATRVD